MADQTRRLTLEIRGETGSLSKALKGAGTDVKALEKGMDSLHDAALRMDAAFRAREIDRFHTEALKLNAQFQSGTTRAGEFSNAMGKVTGVLARGAEVAGLNKQALRDLGDAADIAELGLANLGQASDASKTSLVGFNATSLGVAGAGLALGTAIGGLANRFEAVRKAADAATGPVAKLLQTVGLFESRGNAGALEGLGAFRADNQAQFTAALKRQVEALKAQGVTVEQLVKTYGKLSNEQRAQIGLSDQQLTAAKNAAEAAKRALEEEQQRLSELGKAMTSFFDELAKRREARETFSLLGETVGDVSFKMGLIASQLERLAKAGGELANAGLGKAIKDLRELLAAGGQNDFGATALRALEAEQQRRIASAGTEQAIRDLGIAVLPVNQKFSQLGQQLLPAVTQQVKVVKENTVDWDQQLANIAHTIAAFPGGFGKVGNALAGLAAGGAGIGAGIKAFQQAGALGGLSGVLGKIGAAGQIAAAAVGIGQAIVGLFRKDPVKEAQKKAGKALGHGISREMAEQFLKEAQATGKSIEQVAKEWQIRIKAEQDQANLDTLRAGVDIARVGAEDLLTVIDKLGPKAQEAGGALVKAVADAMAANGLGFLATGDLAKDEGFQAVQRGVAAGGQIFQGLRQAGGISTDLLATGGDFAEALRQQAVEAALAAGKSAEEAQKIGLATIAPLLRDQLNASIESGQKLSEETQQLIALAKENGIDIVADPLIAQLDTQKQMLAELKRLNGGGAGDDGPVPTKVRAAAGFGPFFTGAGSPRLDLQLHPHEAAFVMPETDTMEQFAQRMDRFVLRNADFSARTGLDYSGPGLGRNTTINVNLEVDENPLQTFEGLQRQREFTLRTIERDLRRHLAELVATGQA